MGNVVRLPQGMKKQTVREVYNQVNGNDAAWPAIVSVSSKKWSSAESLSRRVR